MRRTKLLVLVGVVSMWWSSSVSFTTLDAECPSRELPGIRQAVGWNPVASLMFAVVECSGSVSQSFCAGTSRMRRCGVIRRAPLGRQTHLIGHVSRRSRQFVQILRSAFQFGHEEKQGNVDTLSLSHTQTADEVHPSSSDFFLFIQNYGWSLHYRLQRLADSSLNLEVPLAAEWVKLQRPLRDPDDLSRKTSTQIFNWDVLAEPKHEGFSYHVTRVLGSGVEASVNLFKGTGLSLDIRPDLGIRVVLKTEKSSSEPKSVTHCWVSVVGTLKPLVRSVAFFHLQNEVLQVSP